MHCEMCRYDLSHKANAYFKWHSPCVSEPNSRNWVIDNKIAVTIGTLTGMHDKYVI